MSFILEPAQQPDIDLRMDSAWEQGKLEATLHETLARERS